MPGPPVDLAGKKHFRATILRIERVGVRGARYWRCRCTCGAEYVKSEGELINRIGRSCGKCENAKAHIPVGVVLRAEARARGDASYDPRVPCKHGHLARRLVQYNQCVACIGARARQWVRDNPERSKELQNRAWKRISGDPVKQEKARSARQAYRGANPEKTSAWARAFYERHRTKVLGWNSARRARMAVPPWADLDAIDVFYDQAMRLTLETGVLHEVDHIIPLNGKTVSGLHVHWNLRVTTQSENAGKRNKWRQEDGIVPATKAE